MRELEKGFEGIVRDDETHRVAKARAEYAGIKATQPTSYWASRSEDEFLAREKQTVQDRDNVVRGLVLVTMAAKEAGVVRADPKGYSTQSGGHSFGGRKADEPCCSCELVHNVYVDMGLSIRTPGWAGGTMRVSGDAGDVHDRPPAHQGARPQPPVFVRELCGSGLRDEVWAACRQLIAEDLARLEAAYDAAVLEATPAATRVAEKHAKKLDKSRERAARPDKVAKRAAEAKERARESLSKLLGNANCKGILDKWGPEELLGYLRLCQKHEYVLKELMAWSGRLPLGSKVLELEDIQAALEMAKVRDVMES